jgi:hypothetical protein
MWRAAWGAVAEDAACGAAGVTAEGAAAGAAARGAAGVPGMVLVVGAVDDCAKPPVAAGIANAAAMAVIVTKRFINIVSLPMFEHHDMPKDMFKTN